MPNTFHHGNLGGLAMLQLKDRETEKPIIRFDTAQVWIQLIVQATTEEGVPIQIKLELHAADIRELQRNARKALHDAIGAHSA